MKRCIFIDSSSVIRKVARRILSGADLLVAEAANGYEALGICTQDMPDIIVVDASLPDMPVEEFIRRVRAIQADVVPQIAVCLLQVDIGTIMRAKRAGAQGYILKPFNRAQLLDRFKRLQQLAA